MKNKLYFIIPILFSIITLALGFIKEPFWDETHAFEIARLNFSQIFYLTRIEGHNFLWFLVLKPFSCLNFYPYSMIMLNWLFCVGAIFLLWQKAPFSALIKTLIIFSTPFLFYFAPVSRCYAIGIFFLFLICAEFKNRNKKPFIFSTLLFLCANTSILAFICCFYFWLIFLFQNIKRKSKNFKIIFGIFLLNIILFFLQFYGASRPYIIPENYKNFRFNMLTFLVFPIGENICSTIFHLSVFLLFYFGIFQLFKKTKYGLFYFLSTFLTLNALFLFIYSGSYWNYYFYYVLFILVIWVFYRKVFLNKFLKFLIGIVLLFCVSPFVLQNSNFGDVYKSNPKRVADFIIKNYQKDSKLYCLDWWSSVSPAADIYLLKKGIKLYDINGYERTSFESLKRIFSYQKEAVDLDKFYDSLDKSKKNYIVSNGVFLDFQEIKNKDKYYFKYIFQDEKTHVFILEIFKMQ